MTYDPTWIRKSPILSQSIKNESLTAQKESVRLNTLSWGQKVPSTSLDMDQGGSESISITPLNNGNMFIAWGSNTYGDGRFSIVDSDGLLDSTSYHVFEVGNFLDYDQGISTALLPDGNIVIAYGQDQGANNALVFKIYDESGTLVRDAVTVKTSTETNWGIGIAALPDGNFVITWNEASVGNMSYFAIYDLTGDIVKGNTSLGGDYKRPQAAPLSDGNWIVTYESAGDLNFSIYDRQGIQIVGDTLFESGVTQASGLTSLPNGQILIPFRRGFGIIDRQANVVLEPFIQEDTTSTYSVTVLPYGGIVAQHNTDNLGYYTIYDSKGNVFVSQTIYSTDSDDIISGVVSTFKSGSFILVYMTDTSNTVKFFIWQGSKSEIGGDLKVGGFLTLSSGASVTQFSTDTTLSANSDSIVPTQKAIKTYVDTVADHTRIFDNDTQIKVTDGASSNATVTIDSTTVAIFDVDGLKLENGVSVSEFSTDYTMGGYNASLGNTNIVATEYAARKYLDDITGIGGMSEPTGYPYGNSPIITTLGLDISNIIYIEPVGDYYDIFLAGQRWRKTTRDQVTISDVEGLHYVYFDTDGVLKETTVFSANYLYSLGYTAVCYWDKENQQMSYIGDERHGCTMDGRTHANIHLYRGTMYVSGLAITDITADSTGSLDIDAQFGIDYGEIRDEDISHAISAGIPFQGYPLPVTVPMFYLDSTNGYWRYEINTDFAVLNRGSGRVAWNQNVASEWTLTEASDDSFVLTHIFATNGIDKKIIGIVGQNEYSTIISARGGAIAEINSLIVAGLPFAEFIPVATIIFQTSDAFTNSVKATVRTTDEGGEWVDWRLSGLSSQPGSTTSHSALTGLGNDDHMQYYRVDGARPITGSLVVQGASDLQSDTTIGGTLTLPNGVSIDEFSDDVTLSGDSDLAVPTEHAVKTYVDSIIVGVTGYKISQGDSYVEVHDTTGTAYIDLAVDGIQVQYWDAQTTSIKNGTFSLPIGVAVNDISDDSTSALSTQLLTARAIHELSFNPWQLISSDSTADVNTRISVNTSSSEINITLPYNPSFGDEISILDNSLTFGTNNCTLIRNGDYIEGIDEDYILDFTRADVKLIYVGGSTGWRVVSGV